MNAPSIDTDGRITGWIAIRPATKAVADEIPVVAQIGDWPPFRVGAVRIKGIADQKAWVQGHLDKAREYRERLRELASSRGLTWEYANGKGIVIRAAGAAAIKESSMATPTARVIGSNEPGYTETRQAEPPALRRLAEAAIPRVIARLSWFPHVTNVIPGADVVKYLDSGGQQGDLTQSYLTLAGPSGLVSGVWIPSDGSAPSAPTTINFDSEANVTPRGYFAQITLTHESDRQARSFDDFRNGEPHIGRTGTGHDAVVEHLADGLARDFNRAFIRGLGTATDPVQGILTKSITETAVTGESPHYGDLVGAIYTQRTAYRTPNATLVSPAYAKVLRLGRDTTGALLYPPHVPLTAAGLEIVECDGFIGQSTSHAVVLDGSKVVVVWRLQPNGLLFMVTQSYLSPTDFGADKTTYKLRGSFNVGLTPGFTSAVTELTGISA